MKKFRTDWSTFGKITGNGEMAGFPASLYKYIALTLDTDTS